jgi:hypothetical protein
VKRGPIIHGVLLIAALLLAYQTWTRPKGDDAKKVRGDVVLWKKDAKQIVAVEYVTERKTVRIERRDDYLWGIVTRDTTKPTPAKKDEPPAGEDDAEAPEPAPEDGAMPEPAPPDPEPEPAPEPVPPEPETTTVVNEFPVADSADELFAGLATMRMLRDLGVPDDDKRKEFELEDAKTQLTVDFGSETRTFLVGGRVFGGSDRYVQDPTSSRAYVMAGETLRPLEGGDQSLRDRKIAPAEDANVTGAVLKTAAGERSLVRGEKAGPHGAKEVTWADAQTPTDPDQTLANFISRVERLAPSEFLPELSTAELQSVIRFEYAGAGGKSLGSLELFKQSGENPGEFEYFVLSERTRVPAKVHRLSAERIEKDLDTLFTPQE